MNYKRHHILKILFCTFISSLMIQNAYSLEELKENNNEQAISSVSTNSELNTMLKIPEVKAQYDKCKEAVQLNELPKCIWEGYPENDSKIIPALSDEIKKKVKDVYKKEAPEGKKVDLANNKNNLFQSYAKNPAVIKLSEELGKKLHEAMYGKDEENKDKIVAIDHSKFHELYKTEISKGIIDALTSFCMKVDFSQSPNINNDCTKEKKCKDNDQDCQNKCLTYTLKTNKQKENIENNIKKLNDNKLADNINSCIKSVPNSCMYGSDQDACLVNDYLKSSRKNLIVNDKIENDIYKPLEKNTTNIAFRNIASAPAIDMQKTLTVTSKDIENAYKTENEKLAKDAQDCKMNTEDKKCLQFLDTNTDEKKESLADFGIRKYVQESEIENLDKDGLKEYLKNTGRSDEEIKSIVDLNNEEDVKKARDEIKEKFKKEKEKLIKALSERVQNSTSEKNGKISENDNSKLQTISDELQSKTEDLKKLTRFNNLVSSYLTTEDQKNKNKIERNVASAQIEIESDKNNQDNKNFKDILNTKSKNDGDSQSYFDVKIINEILGL